VTKKCDPPEDRRALKVPLTYSGRRDSNPRPSPWQGGSVTHQMRAVARKPLLRGHLGISPYQSVLFLLRHVCGTPKGRAAARANTQCGEG
jgi:hypothetical protein